MGGVHWLILQANAVVPPRLPADAFWTYGRLPRAAHRVDRRAVDEVSQRRQLIGAALRTRADRR
jgi:hypothetical protein